MSENSIRLYGYSKSSKLNKPFNDVMFLRASHLEARLETFLKMKVAIGLSIMRAPIFENRKCKRGGGGAIQHIITDIVPLSHGYLRMATC